MSVAEEIEKLHALKERGVLTPEEFDRQKSRMMGAGPVTEDQAPGAKTPGYAKMAEVPAVQKAWVQIIALLAIVPLGLFLMARYPAYQAVKGGGAKRVGKATKAAFAIGAVVLWLINLARAMSHG